MTTFTSEDFEHAARAAERDIVMGAEGHYELINGCRTLVKWSPPDDDGDALRLERHLRMTIADEPSRGGYQPIDRGAGEPTSPPRKP